MTAADDVARRQEEMTAIDIPGQHRDPAAAGADRAAGDAGGERRGHRRGHHDRADDVRCEPDREPAAAAEASAGDADLSAAPTFTPMTVRPELQNRADVQRALVRNYPPLLRDAGIGGSPTVGSSSMRTAAC
jgi:hypothetical protein